VHSGWRGLLGQQRVCRKCEHYRGDQWRNSGWAMAIGKVHGGSMMQRLIVAQNRS